MNPLKTVEAGLAEYFRRLAALAEADEANGGLIRLWAEMRAARKGRQAGTRRSREAAQAWAEESGAAACLRRLQARAQEARLQAYDARERAATAELAALRAAEYAAVERRSRTEFALREIPGAWVHVPAGYETITWDESSDGYLPAGSCQGAWRGATNCASDAAASIARALVATDDPVRIERLLRIVRRRCDPARDRAIRDAIWARAGEAAAQRRAEAAKAAEQEVAKAAANAAAAARAASLSPTALRVADGIVGNADFAADNRMGLPRVGDIQEDLDALAGHPEAEAILAYVASRTDLDLAELRAAWRVSVG